MKVVCKKCGAVVIAERNDFCPECGANLKDAVIPENEKEILRYIALRNQYEGDKKELFIYLIILGGVLFLAVLRFVLQKALY